MANQDQWREILNHFRVEVDPEDVEQSVRNIREKIQQVAQDGMYTKVRIRYKGRQIIPDIPIGVFLAAEAAGFLVLGPLRAALLTLGANILLDVELIHRSTERVQEGVQFYEQGDVELAEKCFLEALELRSSDPQAHYHLGVLYRVQAKYPEAKHHLEQVIALNHSTLSPKAQDVLDRMNGVINL